MVRVGLMRRRVSNQHVEKHVGVQKVGDLNKPDKRLTAYDAYVMMQLRILNTWQRII